MNESNHASNNAFRLYFAISGTVKSTFWQVITYSFVVNFAAERTRSLKSSRFVSSPSLSANVEYCIRKTLSSARHLRVFVFKITSDGRKTFLLHSIVRVDSHHRRTLASKNVRKVSRILFDRNWSCPWGHNSAYRVVTWPSLAHAWRTWLLNGMCVCFATPKSVSMSSIMVRYEKYLLCVFTVFEKRKLHPDTLWKV